MTNFLLTDCLEKDLYRQLVSQMDFLYMNLRRRLVQNTFDVLQHDLDSLLRVKHE